MSRKNLLGKSLVFVAIALVAILLIFSTARREKEITFELVMPVKTILAEMGDLQKLLRISGFIESDTMVTVFPRISGTLTALYLEMGDPVEEDQIIALIDSEPYQLAFNQAKAAFLAADSTFKRISSLYSTKSVSQQNYDEVKANFDALKSSYELAELNLSYTGLKSPVSGVILEKHVSRGAMVAPQIPVVTVGDIYNLKVNCAIPEIHYSFFAGNMNNLDVILSVPALANKKFLGTISHIAPFISPQTRTFIVKCEVVDDQSLLRPGMFSYVDFVLEEREQIHYLPFKTLSRGDELWYADEENRARVVNFTPHFNNGVFFQIPAELSDKRFIIEGQSFLKEGTAIR